MIVYGLSVIFIDPIKRKMSQGHIVLKKHELSIYRCDGITAYLVSI